MEERDSHRQRQGRFAARVHRRDTSGRTGGRRDGEYLRWPDGRLRGEPLRRMPPEVREEVNGSAAARLCGDYRLRAAVQFNSTEMESASLATSRLTRKRWPSAETS